MIIDPQKMTIHKSETIKTDTTRHLKNADYLQGQGASR
jgi:hypothetical protein